jgi:DNA modification methylase
MPAKKKPARQVPGLAAKIELWPLDRLKPYENNAKVHGSDQVEQIAQSVLEYGFNNPILVDGEDIITAGHGRLLAAFLIERRFPGALGDGVPVVQLTHLTPAMRRAYTLADNRLAELAPWDEEALAKELNALADSTDLDMGTLGWSEAELADLRGLEENAGEAEIPPPMTEPPTNPAVRIGDIWLLGEHRLACADATLPETWNTLVGHRGLAACVFTDPPYGVSWTGRDHLGRPIAGDDLRGEALHQLLAQSLQRLAAHTRQDAAWYIWHDPTTRRELREAMDTADLVPISEIIWAKPSGGLGWGHYRAAHEPCYYAARAGETPRFRGQRDLEQTIWRVAEHAAQGIATTLGNGLLVTDGAGGQLYIRPRPPKGSKLRRIRVEPGKHLELAQATRDDSVWEVGRDAKPDHPTQKPVELARRAIENSTEPGELVLDAFMGGGTTLLAAESTRRVAYGTELNPGHVETTIQRWEKMTGGTAVLEGNGESLEETRRKRTKKKAKK